MPQLDPDKKQQLDSNIKLMLKNGASEQDIINYANDFNSKYALKKKESSRPTSQETAGVSPTRPTQQGTSLDTEPPTRAQASGGLSGFQSIDPFGGKGAVGAIISEQQKTQPSESYAVQVFKKSKSEVDENLTEERLLEEKNQSGILNNLGKVAKSIWNVTGTGLSSINEALGGTKDYFTIDEYKPLQEEKIQAKRELEKEGLPVTGDNIQKRAEDIFRINDKRKQLEKRIDANLPEDYDRQGIWKELKLDNLKKNSSLKEAVISADVYQSQIKEFEKYHNYFKNIPREQITQEQVDKYNDLLGNANESLEGLKYLDQKFPKILEEVKSSDELLDVFKYNYNDYEKHLSNIKNFAKGIAGGTVKLMEETARYLDKKTGLDTDVYGFREGNIKMANEVLDEASEDREQFIKYKAKDISNFSDVGSFMAGLGTEQIPVWTTLAIAPELGPALLGAGTGGEQFRTMEIEESQPFAKKTSFGQKLATAYLYGAAETLFEKLGTVSVLKNIEKSIAKASNPSRKLIQDGAMQEVSKLGKQFGYNFGLEGGTEYLTSEAQIAADRYIAGKEISTQQANERRFESFVAGGLMGGGMTMIGGVWGAIAQNARIYSDNKDIKKTKEILSQIERLSDEIKNNPNLTPEERVISYKKMNELTNQSFDIVSKNANKGKDFNAKETQFLVDINVKQAELKTKLQEIKDSNFSKEQKQTFINELKDEYSKLEEKRNTTLQGGYNKLTELPSAEVIRLKDKAARELMKELNPDGTKTITINDSEITKRAIQLLESETKAPAAEEMSVKPTEVKAEEAVTVPEAKEDQVPEDLARLYKERITAIKKSDPEQYWSVDIPSDEVILDAAKNGRLVDKQGGMGIVTEDGNMVGMFKYDKSAKGTAQAVQGERVKIGGKKLDNFDGYLTKLYEKNGFRVVSRVPFNEEYALEGWNKEKHGTPDVVAMIYDPDGKLDIEEKTFDDYDEAIKYRDSYVEQAKKLQEAPVEVAAVEEIKPSDIETTLDEVITPASKDIKEQIARAKKALSKLLPNVEIVYHDTAESFFNAVGSNDRGFYNMNKDSRGKNIIHINGSNATNTTVAHEVFHAVLLNYIANGKPATRITNRMLKAVAKSLASRPDVMAKINKFVEEGYSDEKEIWAEEKLSEVLGYLASEYETLPDVSKNIIQKWIEKIAVMLKIKPFTDKQVLDFMNTIATKVAYGQEISEGDVKIFSSETSGGVVGKFNISRSQKGIKAPKVKDDARSFIRNLVEEIDIREFNGKDFITNMYDYTSAGETDLGNGFKINLFGGKGYVPYMMELNNKKIGDVSNLAAFNTKAQAETFVRNSLESGAELFAPHSGTKAKSWQFQQHTFAELVDLVLDKNILNNKELIDIFNNSIKNVDVKKEFSNFSKKYGKKINNFDSFKSNPKKIVDLLDIKNNYSPNLRKALNNSIASNKIFQKAIGIKNVSEFYNKIIDPLNEGVTGGEIIGVVKFDPSTFEIIETKPNEIDHHPSFGWTLLAKINGIYQPSEFYKSYDITDSYTKYNKGGVKVSIKSEDVDFNVKNVTSSAGAIPKVARFNVSGRKQVPSDYKAISNEILTDKELNTVRASLRASMPNSFALEVLDAVSRKEVLGYDSDLDDAVEQMIQEGVSINNIANILMQDEDLVEKKDITSKRKAIDYILNVGLKGTILKSGQRAVGRKQISPENSSNYANMTEDGKGNFVFYHFGPRGIKAIDPKRYGSNKGAITSKPEVAAMGRVGGMSQFYTMPEYQESNVSGDKYMIKVPMDKVYDFNTDPDNLYDKAREMFKAKHPDLPFTANDQLAYITKLAEKAGYDMTVAEWKDMSRAQSTKALKPVDVQVMDGNVISKPFQENYESNSAKGFVSVIPVSKEAKLKDVYQKINAERNAKNRYDSLYSLAEDFPKLSQDKITDMIEGSDISQEMKDAYAEALAYEPGARMSGRRQKSPIDTAVETAKRKGFNDKDIADYLVGKGYTRAQATNAILRYNNITAVKLRKEDSVFTKEGRNKIITFLDQVKRRALSARSFLPKSVFLQREGIESNIKAEAKRASYLVDDFNRLVKKYKGDVNVLNDEFDKYLRGDQTAVLPDEFKVVAGKMRMHIDNLSQNLLRTGAVSVSQAETIAANLGQYINRSYQVFDKRDWAKQVTEEMKEAARVDLRNMYRAEAESKAKQTGLDADILLEDFINKKIDELISGEDAATFLGVGKTGAKNLGIMKERLDIPLSIRQLMGEYTDASQNYARTVLKITTLAENARFLQSAREAGMGVFFFNENDPNRPKEFNTKIAGDKSDTMSPLNGLYTTPEIAKAFTQKIGTGDAIEAALGSELGPVVRGIYETYMKALSAVKWLKTIGSVATHAKNVTGNLWFMLSNGYYNPKKYAEAFRVLKNSSNEQLRDKLDEYIRAGIIDQSAALGEIKAMFADADFDTAIESRLKKNPFDKAKAGVKRLGQKMTTAYQLEDDFFKIISYESEKARYSNAYFDKPFDDLTDDQKILIKNYAAEITKNVLPNYSRIPGLVKLLKAVPVTGTFVSFQAEAYRTAWNTVALAADELKSSNKKVRAIGAKRLAGIAASQAAKFGLMALMGTIVSGGDDDEDDELKKNTKLFVAPWSKDSDLVLVNYGGGKMSYIDFSASDPHGGIKKAYNSVIAGKDITESFTNGLTQLLEPFMKEDMLLNVITDIKDNKNAYGGKLYNESDTDTNKINAIMERVYKAFEPGTITSVRKVVGSDDIRNELAGQLTGYKINTVDVNKQLGFKMNELKDLSGDAKKLYSSGFYKFEDGTITGDELDKIYEQANKSQKEVYENMMKYMNAASFFGVDDYMIEDNMQGVGKSVINDLWYGEAPDMKMKEVEE